MNLARKVALNTLIQISSKVVSTALGLFSLAIITRYLGRSGFGEYTTIITYLTFFAVIADLGLTLVTVQMISGEEKEENRILNNLFGLRLVSAILILSLAPLTVIFFPYSQGIKSGILIALASFLFPALNQIIIGLFQKKLSMDRDAIAEIAGRLVLILSLLLAIELESGLPGILLANVASAATSFIFHYLFSRRFARLKPEFDWSLWRRVIAKSWPLAVTIVLNLIYLRADTLLLSLFRTSDEVGLYGASYRIIDVLTTVPFMFAGLILPIMTAAWVGKNTEYFQKILQKSLDLMLAIAIPLVIGAQFTARAILSSVAGSEFSAAGDILRVLIFAVAAIFIGTMFSHAVIALDRQKSMIGWYIFTSFSSLIAYLILIPRFSYFGAAGVTIYSESLIAIFSAYCVYKYSGFIPKLGMLAKSLASSLIMGAALYFFLAPYQDTLGGLTLVLISAIIIYLASLFLMGGIRYADLAAIFSRQKKSGGPTYNAPNF